MKRKEFIEKIDRSITAISTGEEEFSCTAIEDEFIDEGLSVPVARFKYEQFIEPFRDNYKPYTLIYITNKTSLRLLLLESFKLECLATKEYLKF